MITNAIDGKRYIGITRYTAHKRFLRHCGGARNQSENAYLYRAMRKHGVDNFKIEVLYEGVNWQELCAVERGLIAERAPEYNMTRGGEGSSWTPDRKLEKSIKYKHKMLNDPEYAERINNLAKIGWTGEHREKRLAEQRSPDRVAKAREQVKTNWLDPDYRTRYSAKKFNPEGRAKHSAIIKDLWKDPEWRAATSAKQKASWTEERLAAQRARTTKQFSDPARRKLASEKQKAYNQKQIIYVGWLLFVIAKYGDQNVRR